MGPAFPAVDADLLSAIGQRLPLAPAGPGVPPRLRATTAPALDPPLAAPVVAGAARLTLARVAGWRRGYTEAYDHAGV